MPECEGLAFREPICENNQDSAEEYLFHPGSLRMLRGSNK
jgi:hypothetical protein